MVTLDWSYKDPKPLRRYHEWLDVSSLNPTQFYTAFGNPEGVYIIWYKELLIPRTIYVGQGIIRHRLYAHRLDSRFNLYRIQKLFTAWATVNKGIRDNVEAYLHNELNPLIPERSPDEPPITVNLPWS